jgi:hypothetical protein
VNQERVSGQIQLLMLRWMTADPHQGTWGKLSWWMPVS